MIAPLKRDPDLVPKIEALIRGKPQDDVICSLLAVALHELVQGRRERLESSRENLISHIDQLVDDYRAKYFNKAGA